MPRSALRIFVFINCLFLYWAASAEPVSNIQCATDESGETTVVRLAEKTRIEIYKKSRNESSVAEGSSVHAVLSCESVIDSATNIVTEVRCPQSNAMMSRFGLGEVFAPEIQFILDSRMGTYELRKGLRVLKPDEQTPVPQPQILAKFLYCIFSQ